jgi:hypothetical protein
MAVRYKYVFYAWFNPLSTPSTTPSGCACHPSNGGEFLKPSNCSRSSLIFASRGGEFLKFTMQALELVDEWLGLLALFD